MAGLELFAEFNDQGANTNYPFMDGQNLTSQQGVVLPKDMFLDASIYLPNNTGEVGVKKITVGKNTATIEIANFTSLILGRITVPLTSRAIEWSVLTEDGKIAGVIVSSPDLGTYLGSLAQGDYTFTKGAATFCPRCVIPMPETYVTGITIGDGYIFTGAVPIIGENGVVVREVNGKVRIDVVGEPLHGIKSCLDNLTVENPPEDPRDWPAYPVTANSVPKFFEYVAICETNIGGSTPWQLIRPDERGDVTLPLDGDNLNDALKITTTEDSIIFSLAGVK